MELSKAEVIEKMTEEHILSSMASDFFPMLQKNEVTIISSGKIGTLKNPPQMEMA